jgi:thiol-disulfide isomerase/thioredoxin
MKIPRRAWLVIALVAVFFLLANFRRASPFDAKPDAKVASIIAASDARKERLDWNTRTLAGAYDRVGRRSRKWDACARQALDRFAELRAISGSGDTASMQRLVSNIATNSARAIKVGCDDPMIAYLSARFGERPAGATSRKGIPPDASAAQDYADALHQAAEALENSGYPDIRKFYANARIAEQLKLMAGRDTPTEVHQYRRRAMANLNGALADKAMPVPEVYEAGDDLLTLLHENAKQYSECYRGIEGRLFENWPKESDVWLLKGSAFVEMAWHARGDSTADKVTEEGWKLFAERLNVAEEALTEAWKLNPKDPRIPTKMLTVGMGKGMNREQMNFYFQRAMSLDPAAYQACHAKLVALEPKWGGSEEELLDFGWQCVESKTWRGKVPLILVDAHVALRTYRRGQDRENYWKQPDVWPEIKAAFDRFFELNPEATTWYQNYAVYATYCEAWDTLNELLSKLGRVNTNFFGGKARYENMLQLARAHAGETRTNALSATGEVRRLIARIHLGLDDGRKTETEFAPELNQFDALAAKYKDGNPEDAAKVLYAKAFLLFKTFDDIAKARESIRQLGQEFPRTEPGRHAEEVLGAIQREEERREIQSTLVVGATFPEFKEMDLQGKPLWLHNYKGKVVLINFWATWNMASVAELPNLLATYGQYRGRGFEIVGVNLDEDRAEVVAFTRQKNLVWPQYFDGGAWTNKLAMKYGIDNLPATFLIDRDGKILAKQLTGEALAEAVRKAVTKN